MATKTKKTKPSEVASTTIESLALNRVDSAKLVGLKRTTFEEMNRDGRLGPQAFILGGGRRWDRAELIAWYKAGRPRREIWVKTKDAEMAKGQS